MPTCPACGAGVGYTDLRSHLHSCEFVWSERPGRTDGMSRRLAKRIARLERRLSRDEDGEPPVADEDPQGDDRERQRLR